MGSDQSYIYGDHSVIKLIEDPTTVRVKICPRVDEPEREFDEIDGAVSFDCDRADLNALIRGLKKHATRVFGRDEW